MVVIIFRHGHKEFSADENPALSAKGHEQARNLEKLIQNKILPAPTHCWFSEKQRTQQTLQSCFKENQVFTFEKPELNHRSNKEDIPTFRKKIQKFIHEISRRNNQKEIHFICTHYDWIEESLTIIDSDKDLTSHELGNWAPGQYIQFEVHDYVYHYIKKGVL